MSIRFAAWAAVSTREQATKDKFSIPNQLEKIQGEAYKRGWVCGAGPFVVTGQSRTRYIQLDQAAAEIEPLRLMLKAAREGEFDVLVMTEFDRLRELLDQVFRTLAAYRVQLYSIAQPIEPMQPDQYDIYQADTVAMMIGLSQITSRIEISRTRRKWRESMPKRITDLGLPVQIPFGYRKPPGREFDRRAIPEPDPMLAHHVIRLKDLYLEGYSVRQLVDYLDEQKIRPPRAQKWHWQTVRDILRNPFYAGEVWFGVSRVTLDPQTAKRTRRRDIPADQVHSREGKHRPLWDSATREAILKQLKSRQRSFRGRRNNQFTGLVKCGECVSSMWRQGNGPRRDRLIWRCSNGCDNAILHSELIAKVAAVRIPGLVEHLRSITDLDRPGEIGMMKQTLSDLHRKLTRLEDAYLDGKWDLDRYDARRAGLNEQIEALEAKIEKADRMAKEPRRPVITQRQWLKEADPGEVNRALRRLIRSIVVTQGKIQVKCPQDAPG